MTTTTLIHEEYCLARPGATGPRIESYRVDRSDEAGVVTSRATVTRCQECGAQIVTG